MKTRLITLLALMFSISAPIFAQECQFLTVLGNQCEAFGCTTPRAFDHIQSIYGSGCYTTMLFQCPAPCSDATYSNSIPNGQACDQGQCTGDIGEARKVIRADRSNGFWYQASICSIATEIWS